MERRFLYGMEVSVCTWSMSCRKRVFALQYPGTPPVDSMFIKADAERKKSTYVSTRCSTEYRNRIDLICSFVGILPPLYRYRISFIDIVSRLSVSYLLCRCRIFFIGIVSPLSVLYLYRYRISFIGTVSNLSPIPISTAQACPEVVHALSRGLADGLARDVADNLRTFASTERTVEQTLKLLEKQLAKRPHQTEWVMPLVR